MKKSILIIAVTVTAIILSSCKKSSQVIEGPQPAIETTITAIASEWLSMQLTMVRNEDGSSYLEAVQTVNDMNQYDLDSHYLLVYAKAPGRDSWVYNQLPTTITTDEGEVEISATLDISRFAVQMINLSSNASIDMQHFQNYQFRYLLVSAADYQNLQVDWSDYEAVALALHLS